MNLFAFSISASRGGSVKPSLGSRLPCRCYIDCNPRRDFLVHQIPLARRGIRWSSTKVRSILMSLVPSRPQYTHLPPSFMAMSQDLGSESRDVAAFNAMVDHCSTCLILLACAAFRRHAFSERQRSRGSAHSLAFAKCSIHPCGPVLQPDSIVNRS